jgi:hypothetical protein
MAEDTNKHVTVSAPVYSSAFFARCWPTGSSGVLQLSPDRRQAAPLRTFAGMAIAAARLHRSGLSWHHAASSGRSRAAVRDFPVTRNEAVNWRFWPEGALLRHCRPSLPRAPEAAIRETQVTPPVRNGCSRAAPARFGSIRSSGRRPVNPIPCADTRTRRPAARNCNRPRHRLATSGRNCRPRHPQGRT